MAQPSFTLQVPESQAAASLCDEGAVHEAFQQLLQEQSMAEPAMELVDLTLGGRGNQAWEELEPRGQHPKFSEATLRILASMPSRTIGYSQGAVISQCYNRTTKLRRRSTRPALHQAARSARPSLRHFDLELDAGTVDRDEKWSLLVKELQGLTSSQQSHVLQATPASLAEKRSLRQELGGRSTLRKLDGGRRPLSCCGQLRPGFLTGLRSLWEGPLSLQPWHQSLKQIGGRFGTSVLSYFLFLKTLLAFNLFLFLALLLFVVAPQAVFPPSGPGNWRFTGLEFLTGAGYFTRTLMYYGYYSNATLNDPCQASASSSRACQLGHGHLPYNLPLAYVFTIGVAFFVTCIMLVYSMSRSFGESYRVDCASQRFATNVFCAWDHQVSQDHAARLQKENVRTQLKELLAEWQAKSGPRSLGRMVVLGLAWALCLGTVLGWAMAVYWFSEYMHEVHQKSRASGSPEAQQEAVLLALPVAVSLVNLVLPYLYSLLAAWEKQESPVLEVYVAVCRNLILKMVALGLLCYHWLSRKKEAEQCWETSVGQELYRLVVMDFLFTLLDSLLGELLWRLVLEKRLGGRRRPEFDIARNVLELIYGQTLTWLGVLFCPLLPAVQLLKLLLLFYIKKSSLMRNCQAPSKPWRASHMSTVFITLLCFPSFLGAAIFLSYTIWAEQPSPTCGPFRMNETIYKSGTRWIRNLEKSTPNIAWLHLVQNNFFLFFVSGALLAVIYLHIQVVKGQRRIIRMLKEQIANERDDKAFLIQKLQGIYGRREAGP